MKKEEIVKRYDQVAFEYNKMAVADGYRAFKIISKWAIKAHNSKKARVLDLGCGTGMSSKEFFKKKYEVTGIDISKRMLNEAKKYPFKKLILQDLEKPLKVKKNYFDIIVLVGVMEFINNPLKLFKEIKKKLKDNRIFLVTFPNKESSKKINIRTYYKKEIEEILNKSGFIIINKKYFFAYKKPVDKGKVNVYYNAYMLR